MKYQFEVIGNVSCATAKASIVKLSAVKLKAPAGFSHVKIPGAPKGFHCTSSFVKNGRARDGICYTGTMSVPKNGFTW